jgi:hypothetical protein
MMDRAPCDKYGPRRHARFASFCDALVPSSNESLGRVPLRSPPSAARKQRRVGADSTADLTGAC